MRRAAADAAITRQTILAAARRTFTRAGYTAASTDAIAAAAEVTRGAVYHHFADKRELFRAVFVELEGQLNTAVLEAAGSHREPVAAFAAGCAAWLDFAVRPDYQRIAVVDAPAVLGVAEWHRIDTDIGLATMDAGLRVLERHGALRSAATPELAVVAFGALTEAGLTLARRRRRRGPTRDELLAAFLGLLIEPHALESVDNPSRPRRRGTGSSRSLSTSSPQSQVELP